jgi:hypothetical protein
VEQVAFARTAWGRNTLRLHARNPTRQASALAVRIRSWYVDSGSGVTWEAVYPAFLVPGQQGPVPYDYFVRPDHGTLRVEVEVEDGVGRVLFSRAQEVRIEPPYRGEYLLQPYRSSGEGVLWETRVHPPFRVRESENFIFYYLPGSEAESHLEWIIPERERLLRRLSKELEVRLPGKAVVFLYPDAETARRIAGRRSDGWAYGRTIVEVYGERRKIDPRHEIVHLLAVRIGSPPALFAEGLATARERTFDNAGKYRARVEAWCRGLLRENALIPLAELMQISSLGEDLTRPRIAYPESACFIRYLEKTHGWDRVREAYATFESGSDRPVQEANAARFARILGVSLREAEAGFRQWLSRSGRAAVPEEVVRKVVREETVPYLVAKAKHLLTGGSPEEARDLLRQAVGIDPADLEARFWMAQAHHLLREFPEALGEYAQVIRMGDRASVTQVAWSRVWSGQILDLLGRREEALSHYRLAEALRDTTRVQLEGRLTTSLEAAREGLARPYASPPAR